MHQFIKTGGKKVTIAGGFFFSRQRTKSGGSGGLARERKQNVFKPRLELTCTRHLRSTSYLPQERANQKDPNPTIGRATEREQKSKIPESQQKHSLKSALVTP